MSQKHVQIVHANRQALNVPSRTSKISGLVGVIQHPSHPGSRTQVLQRLSLVPNPRGGRL